MKPSCYFNLATKNKIYQPQGRQWDSDFWYNIVDRWEHRAKIKFC